MALSEEIDEYSRGIAAWADAARKQNAAVQRLQKAVAAGNLRDLEKLREAARSAALVAAEQAEGSRAFEFDARAYLAKGGAFLDELQAAAKREGVRMHERDGIIYCYPVFLETEPDLTAVRIDRKLEPGIRPEVLVAGLKKLQSKEPKSRPEQFIETLYRAYELVRASKHHADYIDEKLSDIYAILTLLPGSRSDYSELEFTRDIYFLDTSDVAATRSGACRTFTASTVSRERSGKIYRFVGRDGSAKDYAAIKFSPPKREA